MKKSVVASIVVLLVALGGVFAWQYFQKDPAELAENFLEQMEAQNFSALETYFAEDALVEVAQLGQEFAQFRDAFALSNVTVTEFTPQSKSAKEAIFNVAFRYESEYFEPLDVASSIVLVRQGMFDQWKIQWKNNLPLPAYGLGAKYTRVRLEPKRGVILDTRGQTVAGEGSLVSVGVQPDRIKDPELLLQTLQEQLGLRPDYVQSQYEAPGVQGHWFVPLINITLAEYNRVDPVLRPVPGIFFRSVEARAYSEGISLGHVTGYLGEVTAAMLDSYPEREYRSGEIVGRSGLESSQDDVLRGRPGYRFYVELEGSRTLLGEKAVVHGNDVSITISSRMQELAHEVLGERLGSLVVLDAETGAILALASTPSYDPNEFIGGISAKRWQELSSDLRKPMFNRSLQGLYPPGSVFKVVTVAAALDQELYEPTSSFVDTGELTIQGNIIRNFQRQIFGEHDLQRAIVDSINTTVAQVGLNLGSGHLEQYFKDWGLDKSIRLGLPMVNGQIGNPSRSRVALAWSAIGQDQVLVTPLQVAQIFTVFATGGKLPPIHLIKSEGEHEARQVLKPETVERMNTMLKDVVLLGTGREARGTGLDLYAKTGTAETVGGGQHAWFAGHTQLPSGQKLAFALLLEEGGVGGQIAAPLMREFFNRLLRSNLL